MLAYGSVKGEVQDLSPSEGGTLVRAVGGWGGAPQKPSCKVLPLPAQAADLAAPQAAELKTSVGLGGIGKGLQVAKKEPQ